MMVRSNIASKIIVLFPVGRRGIAQIFITSLTRFIFLESDGFDVLEGREFVEAGLVVEDVIEEIL